MTEKLSQIAETVYLHRHELKALLDEAVRAADAEFDRSVEERDPCDEPTPEDEALHERLISLSELDVAIAALIEQGRREVETKRLIALSKRFVREYASLVTHALDRAAEDIGEQIRHETEEDTLANIVAEREQYPEAGQAIVALWNCVTALDSLSPAPQT